MEISTNMDISTAHVQTNAAQERHAAPVRLADGQTVTGEIINLTPDSIAIATEDGVISAALRGLPSGLKIGDVAELIARLNDSGELTLEIKQMTNEAAQKAMLADALNLAGLKNSPENIKLALTLLDSGLPLTKENLIKFNQAMKLMGGDKAEEALFMLKNGLKISPRTAQTLDKLLTGEAQLLKQLNSLADSISNISDPALKARLTEIFSTNPETHSEPVLSEQDLSNPQKAASKIAHAFNEIPAKEFEKFSDALMKALDAPEYTDPKHAEALLKELNELKLPNKLAELTDAKAVLTELINTKNQFFSRINDLFKNPDANLGRLMELLTDENTDMAKKADILKALKITASPDGLAPNEKSYIESKLRELHGLNDAASPERTGLTDVAARHNDKNFSKMRFDPRNTDPDDAERFLNELNKSLSEARSELLKNPSPQSTNIMKELVDIGNSLELSAQLRENLFLQLPVVINNHETNSELFIFKDSKRKKRGGASTALIALDTANLDRIETYIQKEGSSVNLQFRVKTEDIKETVSFCLDKLSQQLKDHGITLQSCLFGLLDSNFSILDSPPKSDNKKPDATRVQPKTERRIMLDVRL